MLGRRLKKGAAHPLPPHGGRDDQAGYDAEPLWCDADYARREIHDLPRAGRAECDVPDDRTIDVSNPSADRARPDDEAAQIAR